MFKQRIINHSQQLYEKEPPDPSTVEGQRIGVFPFICQPPHPECVVEKYLVSYSHRFWKRNLSYILYI